MSCEHTCHGPPYGGSFVYGDAGHYLAVYRGTGNVLFVGVKWKQGVDTPTVVKAKTFEGTVTDFSHENPDTDLNWCSLGPESGTLCWYSTQVKFLPPASVGWFTARDKFTLAVAAKI